MGSARAPACCFRRPRLSGSAPLGRCPAGAPGTARGARALPSANCIVPAETVAGRQSKTASGLAQSRPPSAESCQHPADNSVQSAENSVQSAEISVQSVESSVQSAESSVQYAESSVQYAENSVQCAESRQLSVELRANSEEHRISDGHFSPALPDDRSACSADAFATKPSLLQRVQKRLDVFELLRL